MVFSSITFLFYFLPVLLLVYFFAPKNLKNLVLLAGSLCFYAWGAPKFIFILLVSTIIDFYLVKQLYKARDKLLKKRWLTLSITLNLGLLIYFKYANFFVENLNEVVVKLGYTPVQWTEILLPIGISFYTFQTLTYSIDVYRGTHQPLKKLSNYILYIIMFPQLIAGPIVRFHEIADQLTTRLVTTNYFLEGFIRFSIGLGKKVLIANVLAQHADVIFRMPFETLPSTTAWLGITCYTFQIYFDFAGYSDMAIGLGKMFGFKFPENFNAPYISHSVTEFWRRWHITLGRFMKDYLYMPLGGNRKGVGKTYRNLFIVFVLSGLWHGAHWNFVLWGVFHGLFLVIERVSGLHDSVRLKAFRTPITFIIVMLGWVLFRVENLQDAVHFYNALFNFTGEVPIALFNHKLVSILILAILFSVLPAFQIGKKVMNHVFEGDYNSKRLIIYFQLSILLFIFSVANITSGAFNPFIYFRF